MEAPRSATLEFVSIDTCRMCGAARSEMRDRFADVPDLDRPARRYALVVCDACGLGQTDPFPTPATISSLYTDELSSDYEMPESGFVGALKERFARARVKAIARQANVAPAAVLDFGTGAGRYAAAAAAAFPQARVIGTDFAPAPPRGSYFDGSRLEYHPHEFLLDTPLRFDLILARHVVEHVHDPVAAVRQWLSLLTPGGRLYIEVPNLESKTADLLGAEWPLWYVPKHLSHFTKTTLRRTIEKAGGKPTIGRCEIPMMGNVLAMRAGRSRFDGRFRLPGIALFPLQIAMEAVAKQGTCLFAIVSPSGLT